MRYDIVIIGAGAAGLFAGACLPGPVKGLILERERSPGRKLLMTGNGQCNLTHSGSIKEFLPHYGENKESFLRPALYRFNNQAVMRFFEQRGLPLLVREDGKVFPRSLDAADVVSLLVNACRENGLEFRFSTEIQDIIPPQGEDGHYDLRTSAESFAAKKVICASGGCTYTDFAEKGGFFPVLAKLGLEIVPPVPALSPIFVEDYPYKDLTGVTFPNAALTIRTYEGEVKKRAAGSLLLTRQGFSGPLILDQSRYAEPGDVLELNYCPETDAAELTRRWMETIRGNERQLLTFLRQELPHLPRRFLEAICARGGIPAAQKASRLTGSQLKSLCGLLTGDVFRIKRLGGWNASMVTRGGVALSQVRSKTMEAVSFPGLYLIGEALDVDGDTGGYNLQFAFSSAKQAAESASPGG